MHRTRVQVLRRKLQRFSVDKFINGMMAQGLVFLFLCDNTKASVKGILDRTDRIIEGQRSLWLQEASKKKKIALPPGLAKGMAAEFAPIASNIYQCMDLPCLCSYLRGTATGNGGCTLPNGQPLQKSVRKEYRMLTDDERNRLHAAFRALKNVSFWMLEWLRWENEQLGNSSMSQINWILKTY